MSDPKPHPAGFSWQQGVALVVGAGYLVLGIVGFFFVRADLDTDLAGHAPDTMLGLSLNGAQNFLHVVLGALGLLMSARTRNSRRFGVVLAVVGFILFGYGVLTAGQPDANLLDLNWPSNVLHLVTALIGLALVVRRRRPAPDDRIRR